MQIVNVFLCRSATRSTFSVGLLGNSLIGWGVILEIALILLIDYTPWGNSHFRNRAHRRAGLALHHPIRRRLIHSGGTAQVAGPQDVS